MTTTTLGYILQKARKARKLFQREVAAACGMTQRFYSGLETNRYQATEDHLKALARHFQLDLAYLQDLNAPTTQKAEDDLHDFLGKKPDYVPPRERPASVRLATLRQKQRALFLALWSVLQKRPDWARVRRFLYHVVADSYLEVLAWIWLLRSGLKAHRIAPQRANFRHWPIVEPGTRRVVGDLVTHALYGVQEGRKIVILPQQTLLVRDQEVRPDGLISVDGKWAALEYDGDWKTELRHVELGFPILRFTESEVLDTRFREIFWERVFGAV